jgi:hypothetical protein
MELLSQVDNIAHPPGKEDRSESQDRWNGFDPTPGRKWKVMGKRGKFLP